MLLCIRGIQQEQASGSRRKEVGLQVATPVPARSAKLAEKFECSIRTARLSRRACRSHTAFAAARAQSSFSLTLPQFTLHPLCTPASPADKPSYCRNLHALWHTLQHNHALGPPGSPQCGECRPIHVSMWFGPDHGPGGLAAKLEKSVYKSIRCSSVGSRPLSAHGATTFQTVDRSASRERSTICASEAHRHILTRFRRTAGAT